MNAKGKVIATDLDGTLFYPKSRIRMINAKNKRFLRKFIDAGGRLLLVSGRNVHFMNRVQKCLNRPIDFAGCNGAFVTANKKFVKQSFLNNDGILALLDDIKKRYMATDVFIMGADHNFIVPKNEFGLLNRFGYMLYQLNQCTYKEKTTRNDKLLHYALKHDRIYKIMIFFGIGKKNTTRCRIANDELTKLYSEYSFAYNGPSIEITTRDSTKALGVQYYLDYLKINHHNVMVVGDSGNDLSMFRHFKNSFCMSHARNEVKKEACYQINSVSDLEKYL